MGNNANTMSLNVPADTPVLDIGNRRGSTGYIDFLRLEQVTAPVMRGVDCYNRPCVVIKFKIEHPLGPTAPSIMMETFFQRYPDNEKLWQGCGHATPLPFATEGGMRNDHYQALNRILAGEKVRLSEDCGCTYGYEGAFASLAD